MGSSSVSVTILRLLQEFPQIKIGPVWTHAPKPSGRGQQLQESPLATYATSYMKILSGDKESIELRQLEKINAEEIEYLRYLSLDTVIVVAYGQILPISWLHLPRLGCFNIHFSLLPRYRGAAPIQAAILNGDDETGITIQKIEEKLDTGDILLSRSFPLTGLNAIEAFNAAVDTVKLVLPEFIQQLIEENLNFTSQNDIGLGNYCKKIEKKDGQIRSPMGITEISRKFLAYQPWPGIYFRKSNKSGNIVNYVIRDIEKVETPIHDIQNQYGDIFFHSLLESSSRTLSLIKLNHPLRLFLVARSNDSPTPKNFTQIQSLNITSIQKSGKKNLSVSDFLNGIKWSFPIYL